MARNLFYIIRKNYKRDFRKKISIKKLSYEEKLNFELKYIFKNFFKSLFKRKKRKKYPKFSPRFLFLEKSVLAPWKLQIYWQKISTMMWWTENFLSISPRKRIWAKKRCPILMNGIPAFWTNLENFYSVKNHLSRVTLTVTSLMSYFP